MQDLEERSVATEIVSLYSIVKFNDDLYKTEAHPSLFKLIV